MSELCKPSTLEVEEIIHELVGNILQRFFKDDANSTFIEGSSVADLEKLADAGNEFCDTVGTSRDYLAKLLFWLVGNRWQSLASMFIFQFIVLLILDFFFTMVKPEWFRAKKELQSLFFGIKSSLFF